MWTPVGRELAGIFRRNEMDAGVQRGLGVLYVIGRLAPGRTVWTPVGRELAGIFRRNEMDAGVQRGLGVLYVIGRLAPGRTRDQAQAEMDVIVPALWESHFSRWGTRRVAITRLTDYVFGNAEAALLSFWAAGCSCC